MQNLGCASYEKWPTNGSVVGTLLFKSREMLWHPTKKEIEDWLDSKTLAFTQEEIVGIRLSTKEWIDEYIYSDIHEIFFAEFPILLHEWL